MAIFRDYSINPTEHDRTIGDRRRHKELVEKAIKDNLADVVSEESIIGESHNKKIKIPIRGLKEYKFVYGNNSSYVGSGNGNEKKGTVIGKEQMGSSSKGKGKGAGNSEGEDVYETEVTIEEVFSYLLEDLNLPNLDKKKYSEIVNDSSKKKAGYQKYGIRPRLAKKRTVIEKIKREQARKRAIKEAGKEGIVERLPFNEEDLRYHRIKEKPKKECNAAILCIMDCSGSMDSTKKYLARSFFFILSRFIRMKYVNVEIAFVSHSTVGREVTETEFFHKVESGGTYISSGLNMAMDIIKERFNPAAWNIYGFYVSDGDNFTEDDDRAIKSMQKFCTIANMIGYAEILPYSYSGTMKYKFDNHVDDKNFISSTIRNKEDLWPVLKKMLIKELKE
ncbi:sporulation protein YhbH [Clostridium felsineum]|uniref:sporulation protein YhbH n=1 Tax=Clostridium felsineum TaxID=36839 RepID=UPI00098C2349|nr:sporulation protein YhbH [Clostridium felsineum]URZ01842.1 hypothetical protein CLAUR_018390 [Clostridium felsineum]